ncbi:MAG: ATP-dependent sacrificial sulfur transferase LarE [Defluviitaleaceae bacterium]|nr:ATP-dependent sacrificial sulfur transferase LarE [Defluviitaleaceae bacterium]
MKLEKFFNENPKVAIGFSGGVDSSYLLFAGLKSGADIMAYYVQAAFQPQFEREEAIKLANLIGAKMKILELDVLSEKTVVANPPDRCYHCKLAIFGALVNQAEADGYPLIIDGTNASDDASDRPGMKALTEMEVRSPLRECGLTKDEIRRLSKEAGLFTWDKPSYACLATRIPVGREITSDLLQRVEKSEDALFALGFSDFRVRVYNDAARLQFPESQFESAILKKEKILTAIKPHFSAILLDLEAR